MEPSPSPPAPTAPAGAGRRQRPGLRLAMRALGLEPVARLGAVALATAGDWVIGRLLDLFTGRQSRERRRAARRARAAARAAAALGALKGAFAKAGQFAALRYDVLPESATGALASLRDRVPPVPLAALRPAVESELGAPLESLFTEFEPTPIGSASVAQVHRARLESGESVAVKIQYPWLEPCLPADLALVRALLALWTRRAGLGRASRRRLFEEFATGLREELDFEHEARAAEEIAANLAHDPQIVVPRVFPTRSTRRVLTMSYHPSVRVTDRQGLARLGVAPSAVLEILARAYAKQVFADGMFHADPHPGNLFVLDEPEAKTRPRLLFVDFGLSRRLDPVLRREMRLGIYALLQRDIDAFLAGMDRMEMIAPGAHARVRGALAAMFERIADSGGALATGGAQILSLKDEAKALLQQTEGIQLPNDLLLYAKTLSYVFAIGAELDPDVDLMRLSLPYLLQFLAEKDGEVS